MILFSREDWGARHGEGTARVGVRELVVLHHFAEPHVECGVTQAAEVKTMQGVEAFHAIERQWAGIGYHFVVFASGHVYEGRGWERIGAHAAGHNTRSYGIALAINGQTHEPTDAAIAAVQELIEAGVRWGFIAADFELKGHRDLGTTTCPGDLVYRRLSEFRPTLTPDGG